MLRSLGALRYRDFQLLTLSSLLYFAARWMDIVVLGWLVLELTDSPFMVGAVGAVRFVGWALGPLWGTIADRLERRRLLIVAQSLNSITALTLFALLASDQLQMWQLSIGVLVLGNAFALDFPSRNAMVGDVVEGTELLNAMALNRAAQNVTAIIGPVLGGSLLLLVGYTGAYGLVAAMYLANLVALLPISNSPAPNSNQGESVWRALGEGSRYFLREPNIRALLVLAALANLLIFPISFALMPVMARDVLGVGAGGLGLLIAATGAGALVANLILAYPMGSWHPGRLVAISFVLWPVTLVVFALSPWYPLSLGLLFVGGVFQDMAMVSCSTLLLSSVSGEMRGRVMGMRALAMAAMPVGSLILGALGESIGVPPSLALFGGVSALLMGGVLLSAPRLFR